MAAATIKHVNSSSISSYSYDEPSKALTIHYHGNRGYVYANVPPETVAQMEEAPSIGAFVAGQIKGVHEHTALPVPKKETQPAAADWGAR